jgi:4-hydroxybenzoate polyprenyltransferase
MLNLIRLLGLEQGSHGVFVGFLHSSPMRFQGRVMAFGLQFTQEVVYPGLYLLKAMRPQLWVKNLLVFAGVLFSRRLFDPDRLLVASAAFGIFCLVAGSIYVINDLMDLEQDRRHPDKRKRPLASGELRVPVALSCVGLVLLVSLWGAFRLGPAFGGVVGLYFVQNLLYSKYLKQVVILDVMLIGFGFVLRAVAGAVAVGVEVSSWLILCTFLLALFLGFSKRRQEIVRLDRAGEGHRSVLAEYSPQFLDMMIGIVTAATLMSYALYTTSEQTVQKFHTTHLILTIPFVMYGIFRYLYLMYRQGKGDNPTGVLLTDLAMQVNVSLWVLAVVGILYFRL